MPGAAVGEGGVNSVAAGIHGEKPVAIDLGNGVTARKVVVDGVCGGQARLRCRVVGDSCPYY